MSAYDEYHHLTGNKFRTGALGAVDCDRAMDEIDRLRAWKADATQVIERWERCADAVEQMGYAGPLGGYKSDHVLATLGQLHATQHVDRDAMIGQLVLDVDAANDRANRWAYKMTLLVGWVKNNCTPEQVAAARAASLADQP